MKRGYETKDDPPNARSKPAKVGEAMDAPFRGYVNLSLTDEQKANYDAWSSSSSFWDALESQAADGVNLSLKIDPKSGGFLASGTQRRTSSPNAGLVVTARGRTATLAWGRLLFCLVVLSRKERWEDTQPVADPDRW